MKITKKDLDAASKEGIITSNQAELLIKFLQGQPGVGPSFNFTHLLYYLGGLIAIGAMSLFMNLGFESFGGWGIVFISILYACAGILLANRFKSNGYSIPAGLCATFAVVLTPIAIYGFQHALGLWPDETEYRDFHRHVKWHWLYMELGTLVTALAIARIYKYPFLVMPIAIVLWYLSMDVALMMTGERPQYEIRALVSMYFGLLMMGAAFWVDIRTRNAGDYSFWLYIFGVIAFWGGMTAQDSNSEISKLIYFSVNIFMMGIGVLLIRRVFVVFGAIGSIIYLSHLASSVFKDTWLFPLALSVIGLAIIYLGVLWQKNEESLTIMARSKLPKALRELLESKR